MGGCCFGGDSAAQNEKDAAAKANSAADVTPAENGAHSDAPKDAALSGGCKSPPPAQAQLKDPYSAAPSQSQKKAGVDAPPPTQSQQKSPYGGSSATGEAARVAAIEVEAAKRAEDERLAREAAAAEVEAAKRAEAERLAREAAAAAEAAAAKKAEEERVAGEAAAAAAEAARLAAESAVTAGQAGQYYSDNSRSWYNCTVTSIDPDGSYSVNVTGVGPKKIPKEKLATHFKIAAEVKPGQAGQYYSDRAKDWYKCIVTHVELDGKLKVDVIGVGAKEIPKEKRSTNFRIA